MPAVHIEISDPARLVASPMLSVLLLSYNHEKYLETAIASVLAQHATVAFELLIGDDHSSDQSLAIALRYQREHPETVRVITADANVGAYLNHRRLILAARGDWVAHLDGDDHWLPGKLATQWRHIQDHPACVAVYGNAVVVDDAGNCCGYFNNLGTMPVDLALLLRRGNFLNTSSMIMRKSLLEQLLAQNVPFIDYRMHLFAATQGELFHFAGPLSVYRHQSSTSVIQSANDAVRQMYWEAICAIPRDHVAAADRARGLADFMRRIVFRALRTGRWRLIVLWWPRIRRESPRGALASALMTAAACVRAGFAESWYLLRRRVDRSAPRILYRN